MNEDASSRPTDRQRARVRLLVLVLAVMLAAVVTALAITRGPSTSVPFESITWSTDPGAALPSGRSEAAAAIVDDKLYVFGGYTAWNPRTTSTDAWALDPSANAWTSVAPLPSPVTHVGTAVEGTDILLAGGYPNPCTTCNPHQEQGGTTEVWRYDTVADAYFPMPGLPEPRGSGALVLVGNELHFIGGSGVADPTVPMSERTDEEEHWMLELDDLERGWQSRAPLPQPRSHFGAAALDDTIYVIGGQTGFEKGSITFDDVWAWNHPSNPGDTWTDLAPIEPLLGSGLSHHSQSTLVVGGQIVVLGGEFGHGRDHFTNMTWVYDPHADSWRTTTPLPEARQSAVGGVLSDLLYVTSGGPEFQSDTFRGIPNR